MNASVVTPPDPGVTLLAAAIVCVGLGLLFWPDRGLIWRWRSMRRVSRRVVTEDALKHIYKAAIAGRRPNLEGVAASLGLGSSEAASLLQEMTSRQLVELAEGDLTLTATGREYALHIIRTHRLWERFLADETGFTQSEWHGMAEEQEHRLSPAEADALSVRLGNPTHDPHGDPIPTAGGELVEQRGRPLTALEAEGRGRIVHIEDEPEALYAQIAAERLSPGMEVRLLESTPDRIRFWADGDEHVLAPIVANNITVAELSAEPAESPSGCTLTSLAPGQIAVITGLARSCRGAERRRLLDLGFVPGTRIGIDMRSPAGDPTAYRVHDTVIALRREQADSIQIALPAEAAS